MMRSVTVDGVDVKFHAFLAKGNIRASYNLSDCLWPILTISVPSKEPRSLRMSRWHFLSSDSKRAHIGDFIKTYACGRSTIKFSVMEEKFLRDLVDRILSSISQKLRASSTRKGIHKKYDKIIRSSLKSNTLNRIAALLKEPTDGGNIAADDIRPSDLVQLLRGVRSEHVVKSVMDT